MKETYKELNITVVYSFETGSAHVDFDVYDIMAEDTEGVIFYEGIDGSGADDKMTQDITKANKYINGTVKWDGCSHIYFGDKEGYIHLCGSRDFIRIGNILKKVYERCYEIGKFDYDKMSEEN